MDFDEKLKFALAKQKKEIIEKSCQWMSSKNLNYLVSNGYWNEDLKNDYVKVMEE